MQSGVMQQGAAFSRACLSRGKMSWATVAFFALLILPFFEPRVLSVFVSDAFSVIYDCWRGLSAGLIAALYVVRAKKRAYDALGVAVPLVILCSTFLNAGLGSATDYFLWIGDWLPFFTGILLVGYAREAKKKELIWALMLVSSAISFANCLFVLMFPKGIPIGGLMGSVYFLGHKNVAIYAILPSVGMSFLIDGNRGRICSPRTAVLFLMGLIQCMVAYSATSIVAMGLFTLFALLSINRSARVKTTMLYGVVGYAAVFVSIVLLRLQNLAAPFIEGVLHKSTSFTLRTDVWDGVLSIMGGSPLLGYGLSLRGHLDFNGFAYAHPHNDLLSVPLSGGILALALYVALIVLSATMLFRVRGQRTAGALSAMAVGFFAIALMEPLYTISWPLLLALCYAEGAESRDGASQSAVFASNNMISEGISSALSRLSRFRVK